MRYFALAVAMALLCGCGDKPATLDDMNSRDVTLPHGQVIRAETMIGTTDMLRGLMFRTSLAPDRGMLFVHQRLGRYPYWMYQTLIPLDMIWMDSSKRIIEIVPDAPPCKTEASKCPHFGGNEPAKYVLELSGGMARKYGINIGDYISF